MDFCALCREERELRRSHILPEFAYRPTYDDSHTALLFEADIERKGIRRRGYWDYLLCDECEGKVGRWESYFADAWFTRPLRPATVSPGWLTIPTLAYAPTKLLFLSVFWRASVSRLDMFRHLSLGPHEERIRRRLMAEDPGPDTEYPIMALGLRDPETGGFKDDLVNVPGVARIDGHHVYRALFGGVFWYCSVSRHHTNCPVSPTLRADNTLLLSVDDWGKHAAVKELAGQIQRLTRDRPA